MKSSLLVAFLLAVLPLGCGSGDPEATPTVVIRQRSLEDAGRIEAMALSPNFPADKILFAGTEQGGVFRSADGGATGSRSTRGSPTTASAPSPSLRATLATAL